jgi:hypothetical protein
MCLPDIQLEIDFPATQLFPKQLAALKERMLGKLDTIQIKGMSNPS